MLTTWFNSADVHPNGRRPWDIQVHNPRLFSRLLADGNLGFGEAYMEGWWDCADIAGMIARLLRAKVPARIRAHPGRTAWAWATSYLCNLQTRRRARIVGRRHYDLGNDFFAAMLDPAMQYSCAWFHDTDDLAAAQQQKLDLICRKLGLHPGMRLLDIGCGWGGLARHAAENHGCQVVGVTISREQQRFAVESCRGLPVEIRLQDYRDIRESFDRVVSVGMIEHVGFRNYHRFMAVARRCLRHDGDLFLCQTIASPVSRRWSDPWITRYIFPHSQLPSAAQVTAAAEGRFVLEHVENLGVHYDRTLLAWEANVARAWPRFRERYGETFRRMWRYYLLSCAGAFRARDIELYQFVFSKGGVPGGYQPAAAGRRADREAHARQDTIGA